MTGEVDSFGAVQPRKMNNLISVDKHKIVYEKVSLFKIESNY